VKLYLAPIKGITDTILRNALQKHWGGFDEAVAPFFDLPSAEKFDEKLLSDIILENQTTVVIPQIITKSPSQAKQLTKKLIEMGHKKVNLNFSCPFEVVTKKNRGSILMKNPYLIKQIVEAVNELPVKLSIKIRLGYDDFSQAKVLLDTLKYNEISKVFLHARLAEQFYKGDVNLKEFSLINSNFPIVYNGDINSLEAFQKVVSFLPQQDEFMIGRGAISNPAIFNIIKGKQYSDDEYSEIFRAMLLDIVENYREKIGEFALSQMKALWKYFQYRIKDKDFNNKIFQTTNLEEMIKLLQNKNKYRMK
jgi:tRNA-dihydrouridine synthase